MRKNDDYVWCFIAAGVMTVAYMYIFMKGFGTWKNPWIVIVVFVATVLFELTIGFIKWRRFKKENG